MRTTTAFTISLTLFALAFTGCGSATMIRQDAHGGKLRLDGSYGFAVGDARAQVIEHCNGRYEAQERAATLEYRCLGRGALTVSAAESTATSPRRFRPER